MRSRLIWLAVSTALLGSCEPSRPAEPACGNHVAVTHTKTCECQSCEPAECCPGDAHTTDEESGHQYSLNCGPSVADCKARCFQHVWRISVEQSCKATTPLVCCNG